MAYGQFAGACGSSASSAVQGGGVPLASGDRAFTLVPSLCISERYDSNVFFSRPRPNFQREDYVTSVNPMLRVDHNGDYATGSLVMGGTSETYVNNSGLNYLGSNGTLFLSLDNSIKKLVPNAGLLITDTVSYTPTPPGFVNPAAGTSPGASTNIQDVFAQGILFTRTNRVSNSGSVAGSYDISARTSVNASYTHSVMRFLSAPQAGLGSVSGSLFNTTTQTGTVGGSTQVSNVDRLSVRYSHTGTEIGNDPAASVTIKTNVVTAGWSRALTPNITIEAGGGGIFIDAGRSTSTYAVNGAMITQFMGTQATLSYARSAFPSFSLVPTQVVGHVVSLSAVHQISQQWTLSGGGNYSDSSGVSGVSSIKYNSYGGSVDLAYSISRTWSTALGYSYLRFDRESGALRDQFDRHSAMISVRASWD